jgi:hypothetical protein
LAANVREGYALSKKTAQKFSVERFNLRKLNELEDRKEYQIKISKRFTGLKTLSDSKELIWLGKKLRRISKRLPKQSSSVGVEAA